MSIVYSIATKDDIDELIRMRIEYMIYDFGSATDAGYPIYAKVGFKDKEHRYRDMRYKF